MSRNLDKTVLATVTQMDAPYPGEGATPKQILLLAAEYRAAAQHLLNLGRKGDPLSRAPGRLVAQHAIELYLNAFLIMKGEDRKSLRDHDLADRANRAKSASLGLRKRTLAHLVEMTTKREYLVTRYAPELTTTLSEINRLMATVEEVARKVGSPRP